MDALEEIKEKEWLTNEIWGKIDKETADFAFYQGENYLKEICEVSASITNRCYTLLSIILALCPFLITTVVSLNNFIFSSIIYFIGTIYIGLSIAITGLIKPRSGYSPGRPPKDLLKRENLEHYKKSSECSYVKYELENLQRKIECIENSNKIRAKSYRLILFALIGSFAFSLAFALVFITFFREPGSILFLW